MNEVLQELQTTKFWILAAVGVVLSVFANFATDWVKAALRSDRTRTSFKALTSQRAVSSGIFYFICLVVSLQSFFLMKSGYYWTPRIVAGLFALYRSTKIAEQLAQQLPNDQDSRRSILTKEMLYYFGSTWIALFGAARLMFWLSEFDYLTALQAAVVLVLGFATFWATENIRSNAQSAA